MDPIKERFAKIHWQYGDGAPIALAELERRIAAAGHQRLLITYSDLVEGVPFNLPNVRESPHIINVSDWSELDRTIVGSFLGYISKRSYEQAGFFASALVVNKTDGSPGDGFNRQLHELGLVATPHSPKAFDLWVEQVSKAHAWFAKRQ